MHENRSAARTLADERAAVIRACNVEANDLWSPRRWLPISARDAAPSPTLEHRIRWPRAEDGAARGDRGR